MGNFWNTFGWPLIFAAAAGYVYFGIVRPKLTIAGAAMGKADTVAAATGFSKVWASLAGYKTIIVSAVGGIAQLFTPATEQAVKEFAGLPWPQIVDQATANKISIACTILVWLTHAVGYEKAAVTVPKV
jgi:hypothetical protein